MRLARSWRAQGLQSEWGRWMPLHTQVWSRCSDVLALYTFPTVMENLEIKVGIKQFQHVNAWIGQKGVSAPWLWRWLVPRSSLLLWKPKSTSMGAKWSCSMYESMEGFCCQFTTYISIAKAILCSLEVSLLPHPCQKPCLVSPGFTESCLPWHLPCQHMS